MPGQLTIDVLYDALQEAVEKEIIQDWSVDGMRVVFCRNGDIIAMPALEARAYLESLIQEKDRIFCDRSEIDSRLHCMQKRRYVLEGLLDDRLDLEAFNRLVETAVRELSDLKKKRLERARAQLRGEHHVY